MTLIEALTAHTQGKLVQILARDNKWHTIAPNDPWYPIGWKRFTFRLAPSELISDKEDNKISSLRLLIPVKREK